MNNMNTELEPAAVPQDAPDHLEDTIFTGRRIHIGLRGIITTLVVLTVCIMSFSAREIKEPLYTIASMAIGWYFGRVPNKKLT